MEYVCRKASITNADYLQGAGNHGWKRDAEAVPAPAPEAEAEADPGMNYGVRLTISCKTSQILIRTGRWKSWMEA
jgi:hypothetical protein